VLAYYVQDHGEKLYRRGMYNFIKRTVPPPVMLMFDASNRDQCEVKRMRTNTPLQALVMMNDPMVLEASRVLAERLMLENTSPGDKIGKAFRLVLCRKADEKELTLLNGYYDEEKASFAAHAGKAAELIKQGEFKHEDIKDTVSLAALMQVVHTLYNTDEAITR
jgi:hypothetical protein